MDRRTFVAGAVATLAAPVTAGAQRQGKVARIGFLVMARNPGVESAFPRGLAERGYLEGRDVTIEWRSADGRGDRMETLARELVRFGVDVIVAGGPEARIAAMKATTTIPIVVVGGSDAVAEGWAASLARPGGNVTGLTVTYPEILAKKLELLTELISELSRVAVIWDPDAIVPRALAAQTTAIQTAARSLRVDIDLIEVRRPADLHAAFRRAVQGRRQAVIVNETAMVFAHRADIAELAQRSRRPAIGQWRPSASAGFLATYGADLGDLLRRAAGHVDKILEGAKPGALPVERPTKLELIINLKTAKLLGLTIPAPLLLRADQVIQ
ncbi:MAG TPA: ABC transporter substrate-binding protein [Methylomirabilota bacterium]